MFQNEDPDTEFMRSLEEVWSNAEHESRKTQISYPDYPEVMTYFDEIMDTYDTPL